MTASENSNDQQCGKEHTKEGSEPSLGDEEARTCETRALSSGRRGRKDAVGRDGNEKEKPLC